MKRIQWIFGLFIMTLLWQACHEDTQKKEKTTQNKNHLNIPESGIESMMEENTSKIIEGTQGSVVVTVGEVTRKKADISIKRNDRTWPKTRFGKLGVVIYSVFKFGGLKVKPV